MKGCRSRSRMWGHETEGSRTASSLPECQTEYAPHDLILLISYNSYINYLYYSFTTSTDPCLVVRLYFRLHPPLAFRVSYAFRLCDLPEIWFSSSDFTNYSLASVVFQIMLVWVPKADKRLRTPSIGSCATHVIGIFLPIFLYKSLKNIT